MTVCTRQACQAKVHPHALESPAKAITVMKSVGTTPHTIEIRINFCLEAISDSAEAAERLS